MKLKLCADEPRVTVDSNLMCGLGVMVSGGKHMPHVSGTPISKLAENSENVDLGATTANDACVCVLAVGRRSAEFCGAPPLARAPS